MTESSTPRRYDRRIFLAAGGGALATLLAAGCQRRAGGAAYAGLKVHPPSRQMPSLPPSRRRPHRRSARRRRSRCGSTCRARRSITSRRVNDKFTAESGIEVRTTVVPIAEMPTKLATAVAGGSPAGRRLSRRAVADQQPDAVRQDRIADEVPEGHRDARLARPGQETTRAWRRLLRLACQLRRPRPVLQRRPLQERAGLDPDKPPATWDDLVKNAKAIAKPDQQIWGHYVGTKPIPWSADQVWIAYLWQAGGSWLSPDEKKAAFNSDAGVEALKFYVDLVNEHKVTRSRSSTNRQWQRLRDWQDRSHAALPDLGLAG